MGVDVHDDPTIPAQYPNTIPLSTPTSTSSSSSTDIASNLPRPPVPSPSTQVSSSGPSSPRTRLIQIVETPRPSKNADSSLSSEPSTPSSVAHEGSSDGKLTPGSLSRQSSVKFAGKLMEKLHLRHPSSNSTSGGSVSPSAIAPLGGRLSSSRPHSIREGDRSPRRGDKDRDGTGRSRGTSGQHTPHNATGDFGQFLAAAELEAALQEEQKKAAKREAEHAKKEDHTKHQGKGFSVGNRKSRRLSLSTRPTFQADSKQTDEVVLDDMPIAASAPHFPGDLLFVSGGSNYSPSKRSNDSNERQTVKGPPPPKRPWLAPRATLPQASHAGSPNKKSNFFAPPAICGDVSDSDSDSGSEGQEILPLPTDDQTEAKDSTTGTSESREVHSRPASVSSLSSSASTVHETALADSQITTKQDADLAVKTYWSHRKHDDPSLISLKSWNPSDEDARSVQSKGSAAGGASNAISQPLMELEELELESFLRNFGRHTREVRVPASQNFPQQRMPRWDDFRVPADEEARAAAAGRRVTVLTHVDRGLQRLLAEGPGGALPRDATFAQSYIQPASKSKKVKEDDKAKKGKKKEVEPPLRSPLPSSLPLRDDSDGTIENDERAGRLSGQDLRWNSETGLLSETSGKNITHTHSGLPGLLGLRKRGGGGSGDKPKGSAKKPSHKRSTSGSTLSDHDYGHSRTSTSTDGVLSSPQSPSLDSSSEHEDVPALDDDLASDKDKASDAGWQLVDPEEAMLPDGVVAKEVEVDSAKDEKVDGVAFCIAYILALVERYAPEHLDDAPNQAYRESKARSHLERVYLVAPFWENFVGGLRSLYRWEDPRRTGLYAMGYFCLWYADLIPTAGGLYLIFNICRYRFFPPDASVLHAAVRRRMQRGIEADKLAERLRRRSRLDVYHIYNRAVKKYGVASQVALGDVADFHEMSKNLILWRNPTATWRTIIIVGCITAFLTFASAHVIAKTVFFGIGFMFFILMPLQSHYPRYRRPLIPLWWVLWGCPTDAQFAVALLRRRHLESQRLAEASSDAKGSSTHGPKAHPSAAAHSVSHGGLDGTTLFPSADTSADRDALSAVVDSATETSRTRKVGSFFCQHHGVPGHLHITMERLYFVGIYSAATAPKGKSHKVAKTPLSEIAGLVKTKSINLWLYQSAGLQVVRKDGTSIFFSNVAHRDAAFNLLLAVGSETHVWTKV